MIELGTSVNICKCVYGPQQGNLFTLFLVDLDFLKYKMVIQKGCVCTFIVKHSMSLHTKSGLRFKNLYISHHCRLTDYLFVRMCVVFC
jgi:hypothetical protein